MRPVRTTITTLCFMSLLGLGCDDDAPPAPADHTHDGGVYEHTHDAAQVDLGMLEDAIDALEAADEQLGADLAGLASGLEDAEAALDGLDENVDAIDERVNEHDDRITALEPCEGEACEPDYAAQLVDLFRPIIVAGCEDMTECCSPAQVAQYYGPSFDSVEECVALHVGYIERGGFAHLPIPYGLWGYWTLLPDLTSGSIELVDDESLVEACVEHIHDNACGVPEPIDQCDDEAWVEREDPCSVMNFVRGTRGFGESCSAGGGLCDEGLSCQENVCTRLAVEGDVCARDIDCGAGEYERHYESGLHCNLNTGRCEPFKQLGEPCEIMPYVGDGTDHEPVECEERLSCHPEQQACVAACSEGAVCLERVVCEGLGCTYEEWCGGDLVCAVDYWGNLSRRRCREPFALGTRCVVPEECASGACEYVPEDERYECVPAREPDGSSCTLDTPGTGQSDATCASGWCAGDGKCAAACAEDAPCEDGRICVETPEVPRCEAAIANGDECVTPLGGAPDDGCASGFCDETTCALTAEEDGACPTGRHAQCPSTQYCDEGTCTDRIASGQACSDSSDTRCAAGLDCAVIGEASACHAPGAYPSGAGCWSDSLCASGWCDEETCRALLEAGEACERSWEGLDHCAAGLTCLAEVCAESAATCTLPLF